MNQPLCPYCQVNPTSQTMQIGIDIWRDLCDACAQVKQTEGYTILPIELPSEDTSI